MLYELQTYTLTSRSQSEVEARLEHALPQRTRWSPLAACWRTEIGLLNQLIFVWPYASAVDRDAVNAGIASAGGWPPDINEFVVNTESKVMVAAPFSPPMQPARLGNVYEIRVYAYPTESMPRVLEAWAEALPERVKYSPLVAALYAENGPLTDWVHIWAYENAGERERIRDAVAKAGIWPMSVIDKRLKREPRFVAARMQNMLVVPTRFSPLR